MSVTISATNGSGSTSPLTVLSPYAIAYEGRNLVMDLLGGGIAIALVAPRPSSGTLEFLYASETEARAGATLHRQESSFVLTDSDSPAVGIEYVLSGAVRLRLDEESLLAWILSVDYQEVEP